MQNKIVLKKKSTQAVINGLYKVSAELNYKTCVCVGPLVVSELHHIKR